MFQFPPPIGGCSIFVSDRPRGGVERGAAYRRDHTQPGQPHLPTTLCVPGPHWSAGVLGTANQGEVCCRREQVNFKCVHRVKNHKNAQV